MSFQNLRHVGRSFGVKESYDKRHMASDTPGIETRISFNISIHTP